MGAQGIVVLPGQGLVSSLTPGRPIVLKLRGGETGDSIMLFEETVPAGKKSYFHLHHDSDEVAYVLSGEVTFKIGGEVTVGGPGSCTLCRAACRIAGRAPLPKRGACCFSILRPRQVGWSKSSNGPAANSHR